MYGEELMSYYSVYLTHILTHTEYNRVIIHISYIAWPSHHQPIPLHKIPPIQPPTARPRGGPPVGAARINLVFHVKYHSPDRLLGDTAGAMRGMRGMRGAMCGAGDAGGAGGAWLRGVKWDV